MIKNINFFLGAILLVGIFGWGMNFSPAQISQPVAETLIKPKLNLSAKAVLSIKQQDGNTETIIYKKNEQEVLPIASLAKLMAAVIVAENTNYDFKKQVIVSSAAAKQGDVPHYGNLEKGIKLSIGELFNLMITYSSNDAAFALAEFIGVENFVAKMNNKAREWGMENTSFANPTGLDSVPENYSTAQDLLKLSQRILKEHPLIFETTLESVKFPFENGVSELVLPDNFFTWGGKTGQTKNAGGCLIYIFQNSGNDIYINIILGSESDKTRIEDMQKIIDWIVS